MSIQLLAYSVEVAKLVNDDENDCRFEVQREEKWIHTIYMVNSCQVKVAGVFFCFGGFFY